ncbi:hypothetical protein GBA52_025999 [Prunus armeniaca]|nr:hypothetical protein GBA52_025999 [Prunus armeniaca]
MALKLGNAFPPLPCFAKHESSSTHCIKSICKKSQCMRESRRGCEYDEILGKLKKGDRVVEMQMEVWMSVPTVSYFNRARTTKMDV